MYMIVCGGRDFNDRDFIFRTLDRIDLEDCIGCVIEGGRRTYDRASRKIIGGADYWAMKWAQDRGVPYATEKADWDRYGKRAGPMRNLKMIIKWEPQKVIAFPGGSGTRDMIERAEEYGVQVQKIEYSLALS